MTAFYVLFGLIICLGNGYLSNEVETKAALRAEVTKLQEALISLKDHSQTQDQKYTAVFSNILSSMTLMKKEHNSSIQELQNQLKSTQEKLSASNTKLEDVKTQLLVADGKIAIYESDLSKFEMKLDNVSLQLSTLQTEVSFEAYLDAKYNIKSGDKFVFREIKLNMGGGFSKGSGIFTAPAPGTYIFWAHILHLRIGNDTALIVSINSSKGKLAFGYAQVTKHLSVNAATPIVATHLNGDQVWFQAGLNLNVSVGLIHGHQYSSCGGYLLRMH